MIYVDRIYGFPVSRCFSFQYECDWAIGILHDLAANSATQLFKKDCAWIVAVSECGASGFLKVGWRDGPGNIREVKFVQVGYGVHDGHSLFLGGSAPPVFKTLNRFTLLVLLIKLVGNSPYRIDTVFREFVGSFSGHGANVN